ncbi:MAG: acetolactate synthase small subunit [Bacteroidota bacterium]
MKKKYTISVFTENKIGLLHRITTVFTRRHINIESLTVSESEEKGVHRYIIVIEESRDKIEKVVKQIEKQVEVLKAFYHTDQETVFQEIALYKVHINTIHNGTSLEEIIRRNYARILAVESDFMIIEKTGHESETLDLLEKLRPFGLLEFVRSGRISITKPMKQFSEYLKEMENAVAL